MWELITNAGEASIWKASDTEWLVTVDEDHVNYAEMGICFDCLGDLSGEELDALEEEYTEPIGGPFDGDAIKHGNLLACLVTLLIIKREGYFIDSQAFEDVFAYIMDSDLDEIPGKEEQLSDQ